MKNKPVKIPNINYKFPILNYLRERKYSFGVAEFELMAGSFAIFHELGIEKTFNVWAPALFPYYLQFYGINLIERIKEGEVIPEYKSAEPGDWDEVKGILNKDSERYKENIKNHKKEIVYQKKVFDEWNKKYARFYFKKIDKNKKNKIKKPLPLEELFSNINHHFINQNPFGLFEHFPRIPDKIMYIGGIIVEDTGIMTENKVEREENESMYAGVPLICIPKFADQWYNASLIEHKKIGIYVKNNRHDNRYDDPNSEAQTKNDNEFKEKLEGALDKILSEFKNKEFKLKEEST
uniref:glucuronosyltransferase n=1 Tax=Meloidogyne hapla TaxID=6305 RepID=A0A1I8BAL8_MELHA